MGPTVSKGAVRNRLNELREIDIVAAETYPETITLYYVNHPESNWPLSPEGQRALAYDSPLDTLSLRDFLRLRNSAGIRTLVLAGFQLSLVLFCTGIVTAVFGIDAPVSATSAMVGPPATSSSSVWSSSSRNGSLDGFAMAVAAAPSRLPSGSRRSDELRVPHTRTRQ